MSLGRSTFPHVLTVFRMDDRRWLAPLKNGLKPAIRNNGRLSPIGPTTH